LPKAKEHRPGPLGAAGVLLEDLGAAGGAQFVELAQGGLPAVIR
jgi:hypothetical protein